MLTKVFKQRYHSYPHDIKDPLGMLMPAIHHQELGLKAYTEQVKEIYETIGELDYFYSTFYYFGIIECRNQLGLLGQYQDPLDYYLNYELEREDSAENKRLTGMMHMGLIPSKKNFLNKDDRKLPLQKHLMSLLETSFATLLVYNLFLFQPPPTISIQGEEGALKCIQMHMQESILSLSTLEESTLLPILHCYLGMDKYLTLLETISRFKRNDLTYPYYSFYMRWLDAIIYYRRNCWVDSVHALLDTYYNSGNLLPLWVKVVIIQKLVALTLVSTYALNSSVYLPTNYLVHIGSQADTPVVNIDQNILLHEDDSGVYECLNVFLHLFDHFPMDMEDPRLAGVVIDALYVMLINMNLNEANIKIFTSIILRKGNSLGHINKCK